MTFEEELRAARAHQEKLDAYYRGETVTVSPTTMQSQIEAAVLAERERCAKIAEQYLIDGAPDAPEDVPGTAIPRGADGWEAECIAARIREGK